MKMLFWLTLALMMVVIGSIIIAWILYALHLPSQLGVVFGMFWGFFVFILFMEKLV
jgi:hypothetical protein